MQIRRRHNDAIDQCTRNEHLTRIKRTRTRHTLYLHNNDAAGIFDSHRHGEVIKVQRLPFRGDVPVRVSRGTSKERHLDRKGLVEQPLPSVDVEDAHEVFACRCVDLSAFQAGVDECAETDMREGARLTRCNVAIQVGDNTLRKVVGFYLTFGRQPRDL